MKKAKSVLSILAMVSAGIALLLLILAPVIDYAVAKIFVAMGAEGLKPVLNFGGAMQGVLSRLGELFGNIGTFFGSFDIANNLVLFGVLVLAVLDLVMFIVAVIMLGVKKQGKTIGLVVPTFVLALVGLVIAEIATVPSELYGAPGAPFEVFAVDAGVGMSIGMGVLGGLAGLLALLGFIFSVVYAASIKCEKAPEEVVTGEKAPTEAAPEVVPVAAEAASETVAKETAPTEAEPKVETEKNPEPAKVIRRILVHRSGKVVRVLNEHYYDVTTNIYVEPGFVDASLPLETEQQHYEKIINASKVEPAPAPAPVEPAPAPAPVEPAPAPAPVEPAPAPVKVKVERIPFAVRMKGADKGLKAAYNEIKSEILSYGIKSRISSTGDTFRLHTKTYVKIVIAGKSLKLYFALDPKAYKDSTFPISDASQKVAHVETPLVFKVKSDLSIRRAKSLIADCAAKDGLVQGEVVAYNHAKEVK